MRQKSWDSASPLHCCVQGHKGIKGHKSAMRSHQDRRPLLRNMLQALALNAPIPPPEKFKYCSAVEVDCAAVHSEFIKCRFGQITGMVRPAQLAQRSNTRFLRWEPTLLDFFVRYSPRIAEILQRFFACSQPLQAAQQWETMNLPRGG